MLQRVKPLAEMTLKLAAVARGDKTPDLVLTNARVLCVYTGRIREWREIWVTGGRIAKVCESGTFLKTFRKVPRPQTEVFNCAGGLLAPGLVDPHIHVESSRVTVSAYAEAALRNGTTTIIADNHEIANVCDRAGIEWMIKDGLKAPLNVYWTVPSTVPATSPELETAGGDLTAEKIGKLMDDYPGAIIALGEKMDYPQVTGGDPRSHAIVAEAHKRGLPVCGHVYGIENVAPFAAAGITDTHEAIDKQIAQAMLEAGMWIFLRGGPPGTAWDSLPEAIKAVTETEYNSQQTHRVCLCTDDRNPSELLKYGLDYVFREAVKAGIDPITAWQMASLNPAVRYNLDAEIGGLGHGRRADIVMVDIFSEEDESVVQYVWLGGTLVIEDRKPTGTLKQVIKNAYQYPQEALCTVKLPQKFQVLPDPPAQASRVNIIEVQPPGILMKHTKMEIEAGTDLQEFCQEHDLTFLTVIERHGKTGGFAHGFVKGLGLKQAAVASTIAHDAHNLIVAGDNEADMLKAVKVLEETQGGICLVSQGKIKALVPLPIAGLMSPEPIGIVAFQTSTLMKAWREAGCEIGDMEFTLLSLSVIPELRLTDKGLIQIPEMEILSLFEPLENTET